MGKITKKVLLEEINKINKMMGLPPKKILNEQSIGASASREAVSELGMFLKRLVTGGEKEIEGLAKEFENPGLKLPQGKAIADEIRYVGEKLGSKASLSVGEEVFLVDVLEKLYPGLGKNVAKNLEDTIITMEGGPSYIGELERIMKNPKYSNEQISKILSDDLGIQGISEIEVGLWRNNVQPLKWNGGIRVPKRSGMGSEPRAEIGKGNPENISKPVELNPQETKMMDEIIGAGESKVEPPESVGILNDNVAEIFDNVVEGGEGQALGNYAQQQGLTGVDGNKLYELANKMVDANQELISAVKQQSNIISKTLEEKGASGGSKPPTPPTPPTPPEPPVGGGGGNSPKKSWFGRGEKTPNYKALRTPEEIYKTNLKHTVFQLGMIAIDIFANGKEFKNYQQPFTGLFGSEILYIKLGAAAADQILFSLRSTSAGRVMNYINMGLSAIDFTSTGVGLLQTHNPRVKKAAEDKKNDEINKAKQDSVRNSLINQRDELRKNLSMDSLQRQADKIKQTADSLKNSKTADSLRDAVMNRFQNQNNKLDTGGNKEVLVDPFKKKN